MRPPISWSQLTSAAVGLWGIGVEGTASLHRLRAMGVVPLLVDDAPAAAGAALAPKVSRSWPRRRADSTRSCVATW